MLIENIFLF